MMTMTLIGALVPALGVLGGVTMILVAVNDLARQRKTRDAEG